MNKRPSVGVPLKAMTGETEQVARIWSNGGTIVVQRVEYNGVPGGVAHVQTLSISAASELLRQLAVAIRSAAISGIV